MNFAELETTMPEKKRSLFFIVLNLFLINGVILAVMNLRYPLVGHDFSLTIPGMLDTVLHFRLNGISIQWFTPTFGGGIPAFPNPNNGQFSLLALMAIILPPWKAIMATTVVYMSAGFLACYYFFHRTLNQSWSTSILGAVFFCANGFFVSRAAPGQIGYVTFSLLALFLIVLLDPSIHSGIAATILGLLFAMYVHFAGYFVIIIFCLSILITMPMIYITNPEVFHWKRLFNILLIGAVIGIAISASKLAAVYSFMRYFPRYTADNYSSSTASGFLGIILQLMGTMGLVPIYRIAGVNPDLFPSLIRSATSTHYGLWELDMAMTPVVFAILVMGLINMVHAPGTPFTKLDKNKYRIALALLSFFIWIGIEFTLAKGLVYPMLRNLPILSSMRANVRFVTVFIFPLAFAAALIYSKWEKIWNSMKVFHNFLLVNALAIVPLSTYFMFNSDMYQASYNVNTGDQIYTDINNDVSFEITEIGLPKGNNTGAILERVSNLNVYEPIFGFKLEYFHPQVSNGSIWSISGGYYNMTDPTGFVYPELNHNKPFDRFRVEDKSSLQLFAKHIQPAWKIPTYQHVLNWLSTITFLGALIYIIVQSITLRRKRVVV